jgi:hypothetical protein
MTECAEKLCLNPRSLENCENKCYFAPFRRFIMKMVKLKKQIVKNQSYSI